MTYEYEIRVLEQHLDTFGHVNNAHYLTFFEEARWEMLAEQGSGLPDIVKSQKGPVILEVNLKFIKELTLRQRIKITTELVEFKKVVGRLQQRMLGEAGELMAEAFFTFGYFDLKTRKLLPPPPEWLAAFQK